MDPKHQRFIVAVIGVVENAEGNVLLIRHPRRGWELPGGAVERGEDPRQALVREVEEEARVHAQAGELVGVYFDLDDETVVLLFRCASPGVQAPGAESDWFSWDEVESLLGAEPARSRLADVRAGSGTAVRSFRSDPYRLVEDLAAP